MMRRRVFLSPDFIEVSRDFVCVRMNPWLDELNVKRCKRLLGFHQNTAIALVAPDAEGVSIDSFPARKDCYWQMYTEPEATKEMTTAKGAEELLPAMIALRERVTTRAAAAEELPALPVHPDLVQTLNLGACDGRLVVALVDGEELEPALRSVAQDEALAGTAHYVRVDREEWRAALADGRIQLASAAPDEGVFAVQPEPFGRWGQVLARVPTGATREELQAQLAESLATFRSRFHKLDRSKHFLQGRRDSILWEEYKPE